jgi:hypothetical protein
MIRQNRHDRHWVKFDIESPRGNGGTPLSPVRPDRGGARLVLTLQNDNHVHDVALDHDCGRGGVSLPLRPAFNIRTFRLLHKPI